MFYQGFIVTTQTGLDNLTDLNQGQWIQCSIFTLYIYNDSLFTQNYVL